ncbi:MAG: TolC family protein [Deltaproteobacteria bacterium]|nr:TolC family protein [Deltaproteobacteria bacterium]
MEPIVSHQSPVINHRSRGSSLAARCVVACLLIAAPLKSGAQDLPERMGLSQAIDFAVKHSALIGAARAGTDVLEAKLKQAEWAAWPHIKLKSLLAPMPRQWNDPNDYTKGGTDLSEWGVFTYTEISGVLPLYTFGKISNLKAAARLGVDVGKAREAVAREEVVFRVKRSFYAMALARELADVVKEGRGYLDKARTHLDELEKDDDPSFDPVDRMKLRVYDAKVLARELEAVRSVDLARSAVRVAMGLPPEDAMDFVVGDVKPEEVRREFSEKELVERAVEARAELRALRAGIRVREAQVEMRKSAFYPDFYLAGQFKYGYTKMAQGQTNPFLYDPYNSYSAGGGLALEWDLEIGRKLGELREAKANLAKLKADEREAENGIRLQVAKLYREMRDARRLVDAQKRALEAARGWVIAKTDLYENDLADLRDVMDGLVAFFQSRIDYLQSVYAFNLAVAQLERSTGVSLLGAARGSERPSAGPGE